MAILYRSNKVIERDYEGSWAISYGDMVTLLLLFFVLFFSIDSKKINLNLIQESLLAKLADNNIAKTMNQSKANTLPSVQVDKLLLQDSSNTQFKTTKINSKIIVEFPEISFFNAGSISITNKGKKALRDFISIYMPYAGSHILNVIGFSDNTPLVKTKHLYKDNLRLSVLRALSAQEYLQQQGIPLLRMKIAGYGIKNKEQIKEELSTKNINYDEKTLLALSRKIILIIEPEV